MKPNNNSPENNWTLDQLGQFCSQTHKRMATDAWLIGKAMCLAKTKCQDETQSFTCWKQKHGFSNATASRYMRLFLAFPGEENRGRLTEIGIMDAFIEAGISKAKVKKNDSLPSEGDNISTAKTDGSAHHRTVPKAVPAPNHTTTKPPWAVEGSEDISEDFTDDTDMIEDKWSRSETLEEECRKALPEQLEMLCMKTEFLLSAGEEALHKAWPSSKSKQHRIANQIDHLMHLLPQLGTTLPRSEAAELQTAI